MKRLIVIGLIGITTVVLSGCSAQEEAKVFEMMEYDEYSQEDTTPDEPAPVINEAEVEGGVVHQFADVPALENRKIIYIADMEMRVIDPEVTYNEIIDVIGDYSAYVESANISSSIYNFKIRVLSSSFDALVDDIKTEGDVVSFEKSSEDITNDYSTFEARYNALQTHHDRIVELMETAVDLDMILSLEEALFEIEADLNTIGQTLANYDSLVEYSTINVVIREAVEEIVVLPMTARPNTHIIEVGRNEAQLQIWNDDPNPVTLHVDVYDNGEFVREYEETTFGDSYIQINMNELESFTEYTVKVSAIASDQRLSYEDIIQFETEKTFGNKIANVFIISYESVITLLEYTSLLIVALVPYAVVTAVVATPIIVLKRKGIIKPLRIKDTRRKSVINENKPSQ